MAEVILALDVPSPENAIGLVDGLPDLRWAKVGPMLFLRSGPGIVAALKERGIRVFLDLKWHDIPHTVGEAVRNAAQMGVDLATVHALGGRAMLEAAVAAQGGLRVAAVSVLTSHTPESYWESRGGRTEADLGEEVLRLAAVARDCGVGAVVASPREVRAVREVVGPELWLVTPGIRPAGVGANDQRRTAPPEVAAAAGATHLVVGRPITRAENPRAVYDSICEAVT